MSQNAINHMMRNPSAYLRYQATGELPRGVRPSSPLIDLLSKISPRDRLEIKGIRIHTLGYSNSMVWQNAQQLMNWLKPSEEVFGSYPAGSYQDKRFRRVLTLDDLRSASSHCPERIKLLR